MALRCFISKVFQKTKAASSFSTSWKSCNFSSSSGLHSVMKEYTCQSSQNGTFRNFPLPGFSEITYLTQSTTPNQEKFFDLGVSVKKIYMPTISTNRFKIFEENPSGITKFISDPLLRDCEMIDVPVPGIPVRKEAVRMIQIRRRKMRIHKRRKLYKKMRFVWEKVKLRRQKRKELEFRNELVSQINEYELFDPDAYVKDVIHKIRYHKKPPTKEEQYEQYRLRIKKNKSNTMFIMPKFDD